MNDNNLVAQSDNPSVAPAQPTPNQTPISTLTPEPTSTPEPTTKPSNKKTPIIIAVVIVALIAIAAAILIPLFLLKGSVADRIQAYCKNNNLEIETQTISEDPKIETLSCTSSSLSSDIYSISLISSNTPLLENNDFKEEYLSFVSIDTTLEDSNEYKKFYMDVSFIKDDAVAYFIVDNNNAVSVMGQIDATKKFLIDLGYPDRNWISSQDVSDDTDESDTPSSAVAMRNTQRRNDLAYMNTNLIRYQTNNRGNLPDGPSYWKGSTNLDCNNNVACNFIKNYMNDANTDSSTNTFKDPDGTPYSLYITENYDINESITTYFGSEESRLSLTENGITIGGTSPFEQHVIYVIPGTKCNDDYNAIELSTKRHFSILYMLEDEENAYCLDDQ